jgi:hypothetical protein
MVQQYVSTNNRNLIGDEIRAMRTKSPRGSSQGFDVIFEIDKEGDLRADYNLYHCVSMSGISSDLSP